MEKREYKFIIVDNWKLLIKIMLILKYRHSEERSRQSIAHHYKDSLDLCIAQLSVEL